MTPQEILDAVRAICEGALAESGEGDYYLGRDQLAQSVLDTIHATRRAPA